MPPECVALLFGHVAGTIYADDTGRLLLVNKEEEPVTVCLAEQQVRVAVGPPRMGIGEALFRLHCRDVVAEQKLLFVTRVPVELGQVPLSPPALRHGCRLPAMGSAD